MLARVLFILGGLIFGLGAGAVELAPIPEAPIVKLPIEEGAQNYPCDKIVEALEKYNSMAREHDTSITGFLGQVSEKVTGWFDSLSPLEGKSDAIEAGTFDTLKEGADQVNAITDAAYDNSSLLSGEMDRIIISLKQCLTTAPQRR